ncbi:hypothetical protein GF319_06850 [Candidatus Bathyarchaeota archaeon]|nr:hypothetical protein [Candidatus Bathyarchaeota archaeon]
METVQRAMIPGYVDSSLLGTAYGVYYLVVGSCFFFANSIVGTLWEIKGVWFTSLYSGALSLAAIIGLGIFNKKF